MQNQQYYVFLVALVSISIYPVNTTAANVTTTNNTNTTYEASNGTSLVPTTQPAVTLPPFQLESSDDPLCPSYLTASWSGGGIPAVSLLLHIIARVKLDVTVVFTIGEHAIYINYFICRNSSVNTSLTTDLAPLIFNPSQGTVYVVWASMLVLVFLALILMVILHRAKKSLRSQFSIYGSMIPGLVMLYATGPLVFYSCVIVVDSTSKQGYVIGSIAVLLSLVLLIFTMFRRALRKGKKDHQATMDETLEELEAQVLSNLDGITKVMFRPYKKDRTWFAAMDCLELVCTSGLLGLGVRTQYLGLAQFGFMMGVRVMRTVIMWSQLPYVSGITEYVSVSLADGATVCALFFIFVGRYVVGAIITLLCDVALIFGLVYRMPWKCIDPPVVKKVTIIEQPIFQDLETPLVENDTRGQEEMSPWSRLKARKSGQPQPQITEGTSVNYVEKSRDEVHDEFIRVNGRQRIDI
eukprot:PhF_6_TR427/c0_g1_i1/m.149